jgi:hypothetical protein
MTTVYRKPYRGALELDSNDQHSKPRITSGVRVLKRYLVASIIVCTLILLYLITPSPISTPIWTVDNTFYPHIKPTLLPINEQVTIEKLTTHTSQQYEIDKEWLAAMSNKTVIGIDFEFVKGYSEKYLVFFEDGYTAVVCYSIWLHLIMINLESLIFFIT